MADVAPEFHHEGLAKAHDFSVGFALRVKVRATLATAHGQAGQGILEDLLEGEELENGGVDAGMETETALVGSNGAVELNAEATVDLRVARVVNPRNTEVDEALGFDNTLHDGDVRWIGLKNRLKRFQNFLHRLVKLRLVGVTGYDFCINCITGAHRHTFSHPEVCCAALMQTLSNGCPCTVSTGRNSAS